MKFGCQVSAMAKKRAKIILEISILSEIINCCVQEFSVSIKVSNDIQRHVIRLVALESDAKTNSVGLPE